MKNILVGIDSLAGAHPASAVISHAVELARAFSGTVWLVHVVPPGRATTPFPVPREVLRGEMATELCQEHKAMQHLTQHLRDSGIDAKAFLVEGATVKAIVGEAQRMRADLIVVGTHSHGFLYRALLDGTGERLLHASACPVLFVPEEQGGEAAVPAERT